MALKGMTWNGIGLCGMEWNWNGTKHIYNHKTYSYTDGEISGC